jgi:glycosyltransferase involved in cell wall biosynthesis
MVNGMQPDVTVVVPVLDEAGTIGACLEALAQQDIDGSRVEVLVVDGGSSDSTRDVVSAALARGPWHGARLLSDEEGTRPANLNRGLAEARGAVLCRVDARSRIPRDYLRRCVDTLRTRDDIAVTGGRQVAVSDRGRIGAAIARAFNNRAVNGFSRYRGGHTSGPADTVYLGAFRTAQLRAAGGWQRGLPVNEDFELNRRMSRLGLVWVDAELVVGYVPRTSLRALLRQYAGFGRSKVRYWRSTGDRPRARQLALLASPVVAASLGLCAFAAGVPVALIAAGAAVGLLGIEAVGARTPRGGPAVHVLGAVATLCIAGGWIGGIVAEALVPQRSRAAAGAAPIGAETWR